MSMHWLRRMTTCAILLCSLPAVGAALPGSIEGTVTFYGDSNGIWPIEISAHATLSGPAVASTQIFVPGGPYALGIEDGTYYLAAILDRNNSGGPPDPEDTLAWYDGNGDGLPDTVTISGGATVTGKNIALGFIYVDAAATGTNNGTSWANAYTSLGAALTAAVSGLEVWVAQGTYKPGNARASTFSMRKGVRLYGGFVGDEVLRIQRSTTRTILSGEIGSAATTDNVYHVVTAGTGSNLTAVLDGFEIRGGRADGTLDSAGAGLLALTGGAVTVVNCTFRDNYAKYNGSAVAGSGTGKVNVYNSEFVNNAVDTTTGFTLGGAYFSLPVGQVVANSVFRGNSAPRGAAIYLDTSGSAPATLVNLTIYQNAASSTGGALYSSNNVTVPYAMSNSIAWGNTPNQIVHVGSQVPSTTYSDVQGGFSGTGNINADPLFVDAAGGNLALQITSPAIDAGNNSVLPADSADVDADYDLTEALPLDAAGSWRRFDIPSVADTGNGTAPIVDMGAFETTDVIFRDGFGG